ncbi:MAG: NAD(P)-dependent alcohol dehydrogenase [Anaerolineae bacterium]|nr:NAD(P)-dependent alcohol dehydrogenase [Anaerolineae bacterium]
MQAVVYTQLGPPEVLQVREVPIPVPTDKQVLVRVHAASVNALDYRRFAGMLKGARVPLMTRLMDGMLLKAVNTVLGADIAGQVEAVGSAVTRFKPGDAVFGVAAGSKGAFAAYACAAASQLALKPDNVSFEAAAATPVAALTALQALRDHGRVQAGDTVLIQGAGGGVGSFAVQIAKALGAQVTAVCSARNLDAVRSIGADHVIDYTREDFTRGGQRYDVIAAVNGYHPIRAYQRALSSGGRYVALGGDIPQILQAMLLGPLLSRFGSQTLGFMGIATVTQADLAVLAELLAAGKLAPVIDRRYPLSAAAEAVRYLAEGHAQGKVVFNLGGDV